MPCVLSVRIRDKFPRLHTGRNSMERIIVRRGRFLTYELLRRTFGGDPNVEIIWDRRRSSDRAAEGSAARERRSSPPVEWDRLDYLFTTGASRPSHEPPPS
jgi:hypothetical protein